MPELQTTISTDIEEKQQTAIQIDSKLCDNCEYNVIALYCTECKTSLCQACDTEWHLPARKRGHTRRARFDQSITDALIRAEKEGSVSEYLHDHSTERNIKKYKYEADDGDWHVFKNGSKTLHLDSEITCQLVNMEIQGYRGKQKLKLSLPPQSVQYLFIQCIDPEQEFSCELTQRFSVKPARQGALPSITDADLYTTQTAVHVLQQATKQYGTVSDYSSTDTVGADIFQYYLELSGGYCYLYENEAADCTFHKSIEFDLDNLGIYNEPAGTTKLSFDLSTGQKQFVLLKEVDPSKTNKMSMTTNYTITFTK